MRLSWPVPTYWLNSKRVAYQTPKITSSGRWRGYSSAQPLASVQYLFMLGCLDVAFYTKWFISGNVLFSTHANEVMFLLTDQIQPHCVYWNVTVTVKGDISFVVIWRRVYQCPHIGIVDFLYTYCIVVFVKHMVCVSDRKLPIMLWACPV